MLTDQQNTMSNNHIKINGTWGYSHQNIFHMYKYDSIKYESLLFGFIYEFYHETFWCLSVSLR